MYQDLFILGARGKVGKTLVSQIFEKGDTDSHMHENPTRIVGLGEYDCFHFNLKGIEQVVARQFCARAGSYAKMEGLNSLLGFVLKNYNSKDGNLVFVDVTNAREEMGKFHLNVIRDTPFGVVTSNKHPLVSCSFDEFQVLTREPARYGYRCSVMAGAEAIDKIKDLRDLGDFPVEISGCFSGTLGYICTELEKNRKLSEIVVGAMRLGYTEPHPADDLDGSDVERKIIILSRTAGFDVPKSKICRTPFIPESHLSEREIPKFLGKLWDLDSAFHSKVLDAKEDYRVLRYVAEFDNSNGVPSINVGLRAVAAESQLGSLNGTANKVVIRTKTYHEIPYCVEAPGAGLEITAQNIRRDLLSQLKHRVVREI